MRIPGEVVQMQESLRRVLSPLRILNVDFEDDSLQTGRLRRRYNTLQEWYAREVTSLKAGRTSLLREMPYDFNLKEHEDFSRDLNDRVLKVKWGWDIPLMLLKLIANWDYAQANSNKYLLREGLHGFPIMNYTLGEGPYKSHKDAQFGGEDFHVVLRGDADNLIYFVPDRDGLKKGRYVECLL